MWGFCVPIPQRNHDACYPFYGLIARELLKSRTFETGRQVMFSADLLDNRFLD